MWNHAQKQFKLLWEEDAYYIRTATFWIFGFSSCTGRMVQRIKTCSATISSVVFVFILVFAVLFPIITNADREHEQILPDGQTIALIIEQMKNETRPYGRLPESSEAPPRRVYSIPITAYTSEIGQTDDTPCITASGLDVCQRNEENVVAANFLPIGTRVRIPDLYGDRVFYVEDRMNKRYHYKMDIWMKEKKAAKQFGVKYLTIEVF